MKINEVVNDSEYELGPNGDLGSVNLSGEDLAGRTLVLSSFPGADFSMCNLSQTDFSMCDLTGASFLRSVCVGTNFTKAKLRRADLSKVNFTGADFTGADLYRNRMYYSVLSNAKVDGVDFSTVVGLQTVDFRDCDLSKAALPLGWGYRTVTGSQETHTVLLAPKYIAIDEHKQSISWWKGFMGSSCFELKGISDTWWREAREEIVGKWESLQRRRSK